MRYFVLIETDRGPAVVAEVLRENFDDGRYRDSSLAANICGPDGEILTTTELLARSNGASILAAWELGQDNRSERWVGDGSALWLVRADDADVHRRMDAWAELHGRATRARERAGLLRDDNARLSERYVRIRDLQEQRRAQFQEGRALP